jgi:hypothetical protein
MLAERPVDMKKTLLLAGLLASCATPVTHEGEDFVRAAADEFGRALEMERRVTLEGPVEGGAVNASMSTPLRNSITRLRACRDSHITNLAELTTIGYKALDSHHASRSMEALLPHRISTHHLRSTGIKQFLRKQPDR